MNLLLVRHAEAEDAAVSGADFTRKLTAHGQQSATDVAGALQHCLSGSVLIWSSPLLRTRETAEYIAQTLATPVSRYHDAIPAGDLNALSQDWQALPELPDTLIVVGHQPHLGIWTTRITHISVPIKKASVTGIHLPKAGRLEGELQWYALPEMLSRMVPVIRT